MRSLTTVLVLIGVWAVRSEGQQASSHCSPCHHPEQSIQCEDACPEHFCRLPDHDMPACQPPTTATTPPSSARSATTVMATTTEDGNSTLGNSTRVKIAETSTVSTAAPTTTTAATTTRVVLTTLTTDPDLNNETQPSNLTTTTTTTTAPSNDTVDTFTPSLPTTTLTPLLRCLPLCLHGNCSTCTGNEPDKCPGYRQDYDIKTDKGAIKCIPKKKKEDSGLSIVIIAGASAGGGAVLIGVLVLVACLCCRRRRRAWKEREQGPGMLAAHNISPPPRPSKEEKADDVEMRSTNKPSGVEVPAYVNVASTMPRPVSIERGHDKVTRYVRDPTAKPQKTGSAVSTAEEQEIAELPAAPLPPGHKQGGRMESEHPTARPPARSHTAAISMGGKQDPRRRKDPHKAATLPVSSPLPSAGSDFPRFPIEELEEQNAAAAAAEELEDPEDEYENVKLNTKPAAPDGEEEQLEGIDNPGLDLGEEPEDEYANQAAIVEALNIDDHPYANMLYQRQY